MPVDVFGLRWTKPQPFDEALTQAASQGSGIYSMFQVRGQTYRLWYIGMSTDFYRRFGTHRNNASHLMPSTDMRKLYVSFGLPSYFEQSQLIQTLPTSQLRQLESFLINTLRPEGNDASTKKGYKGNPIILFNESATVMRPFFKKAMSNSTRLVELFKYYFR